MAKWTEVELSLSVQEYMAMYAKWKAGQPFSKKDTYRKLSKRFGRSEGAYEYRMQNISHVMQAMGREWIRGLPPAKNVGNKIASFLEREILASDGSSSADTPHVFSQDATLKEFDRSEDGKLMWPFRADVNEEDLGFTENDFAEFERLIRGGSAEQSAPTGTMVPKVVPSTRQEFARDSAVVDWVIKRANGNCECCEKPAPFYRPDGSPFLEVHHLRQLSQNGTDRVSNAVAVCPNCHRRLHHGIDASSLLDSMYQRVSGLKRE